MKTNIQYEMNLEEFMKNIIIENKNFSIYEDVKGLNENVLVDGQTINQALVQSIPGTIIDVPSLNIKIAIF